MLELLGLLGLCALLGLRALLGLLLGLLGLRALRALLGLRGRRVAGRTGMSTVNDVQPFSNGSEADSWEWLNCARCVKRVGTDADGIGPCAIETAVSMGRICGTIPVEIATQAGATISEQVDTRSGTGYCEMPRQCAAFAPVMLCEYIVDRRKRTKPKCGAPATSVVTVRGYRRAVCEKHATRVGTPAS